MGSYISLLCMNYNKNIYNENNEKELNSNVHASIFFTTMDYINTVHIQNKCLHFKKTVQWFKARWIDATKIGFCQLKVGSSIN